MERVVDIRRVAKVVKGGRHLSFNAMVVVGDGEGHVGAGLGKAVAVPDAVRKGNTIARKSMISVSRRGATIPHTVVSEFESTRVLLKPAPAGAGIIAGGSARAVLELAGVKDVIAKCLGSRNPINVVKATMQGLESLKDPTQEMTKRKGQRLPPTPPAPPVPPVQAVAVSQSLEAPARQETPSGATPPAPQTEGEAPLAKAETSRTDG